MYWTSENILKTNASKRIIAKLKDVLSIPVLGKFSDEFDVLIVFEVDDDWLTEFKLLEELLVALLEELLDVLSEESSVELSEVLSCVEEFSLAFVEFLAVIELAKEKLANANISEIDTTKIKAFLYFSL